MKYKAWRALDPITNASEIIGVMFWSDESGKQRIILADGRAVDLEQNFATPELGGYWATFESGLEVFYSKQKFHQIFVSVKDSA